jgi:hypothetical protein
MDIKPLIRSFKRECQAAKYALGWGTPEAAREHEDNASNLYNQIESILGVEEAKMEVFG